MKSDFEYVMESLDNIAKNLAIGCQQEISNQIWNVMEQAKAAYYQRDPILSGDFKDILYNMPLGYRIEDNGKDKYGFTWIITRVAGGWIYTAQTALSPCSVFVPYNNEFELPY